MSIEETIRLTVREELRRALAELPAQVAEQVRTAVGERQEPAALLRIGEVARLVGLSKSSINRLAGEGQFPSSVPLGDRAVAWRRAEVEAWIAARGVA